MILAEAFHEGGDVRLLALNVRAYGILADLAPDYPSHAILRMGFREVLMLHGVSDCLAGVSRRLCDYSVDQLFDVFSFHGDSGLVVFALPFKVFPVVPARLTIAQRCTTSRGWTTAMSGIVQRGIGVFCAHVGASTHALCRNGKAPLV